MKPKTTTHWSQSQHIWWCWQLTSTRLFSGSPKLRSLNKTTFLKVWGHLFLFQQAHICSKSHKTLCTVIKLAHCTCTDYPNSYSPSLDVLCCKHLDHNTVESAEDLPLFVHLLNTAVKKKKKKKTGYECTAGILMKYSICIHRAAVSYLCQELRKHHNKMFSNFGTIFWLYFLLFYWQNLQTKHFVSIIKSLRSEWNFTCNPRLT